MPYDHFYTTDPTGENAPNLGYHYQGIVGYVYTKPEANTAPIHRAYNPTSRDHFYTADKSKDTSTLEQGYSDENVAWYMHTTAHEGTVPFYRWHNKTSGDHFYTTDPKGELSKQAGYEYEEISGYIFPTKPIYVECECRRERMIKGEVCACRDPRPPHGLGFPPPPPQSGCRCQDQYPWDWFPLFRWYLCLE